MSTLDINSLARGDSHMVARFLDNWNEARAERAQRTSPAWAVALATEHLDRLAIAWTRHLLHEVGADSEQRVRPTSSQRRKLVRRLTKDGASGDPGLELLSSWAAWLLWGEDELARRKDLAELAGDLRMDVLESVVNHVRRTSPEFNGTDFVFLAQAGPLAVKKGPVLDIETARHCRICGRELTPPQMYPYGPDTPGSTDCGGDCLDCVRKVEGEAAGD